ncbi:unnamed protein product [Closterium sp. NIES-53]
MASTLSPAAATTAGATAMLQQGEPPSKARKLNLRKVGTNPSWSGKYQGRRVQSPTVYSLVIRPDSSPLRGIESRARTKSFDKNSTAPAPAAAAAAATSAGATATLQQDVFFETSQKMLQQEQEVPRQQQQKARACGLGIVPFLEGKHVLITGATGFIGKVLVEKILREQPGVGQLYLLIQPTARATAAQRLKQQVLPSPVFSLLRERHGEGYEAFMAGKLTAVQGNVGEDGLGLAAHAAAALEESVDLIFNFAATVDFEAPYVVLTRPVRCTARGPYVPCTVHCTWSLRAPYGALHVVLTCPVRCTACGT